MNMAENQLESKDKKGLALTITGTDGFEVEQNHEYSS